MRLILEEGQAKGLVMFRIRDGKLAVGRAGEQGGGLFSRLSDGRIAQLIQLYLEKEGFSCRICRDGLTALQVFQEQQPDLIILDLMLPGLDGLEVCARIRQKPGNKDPYILMLTAKGEEIDRTPLRLRAVWRQP
ncbi:response regulator [Leptolyngbya ohadii]|uniref:response regulator n=1 Tax=Leptolyngbya ohadii TaxID=1962290 RepID=UPI0021F11D03|nr:response regulator [Leptolyngbya ohadii]